MAKKTAKKIVQRKVLKGGGPSLSVPDPAALDTAAALHDPPISLDAVRGQGRAIGVLDAAMRTGRVHHAWIFHGPQGVGKFTAAVAFAAALLDPTAEPDLSGRVRPDPESRVASLLKERAHPDLHVVRKELARFSESKQVREQKLITIPRDVVETHLLGPVALGANVSPGGLASKVFVIDEAELLDRSLTNAPVQNSILKTLEEPPPRTVLIMVTTALGRLLPTIRSRSQKVYFGPLSRPELEAWAADSGLGLPGPGTKDREAMLDYAQGSPGRLTEAAQTGIASWERSLGPMLDDAARGRFRPQLAVTMHDLANEWAAAWAGADASRSKDAANRMAAARIFGVVGERARGALRGDEHGRYWGVRTVQAIGEAEARLSANVQMRDVFEGLAAEMVEAGGG